MGKNFGIIDKNTAGTLEFVGFLRIHLVFYDNENKPQGWAYIVLGNDGGDEVSDYSIKPWLDDWCKSFYSAA